MNRHAVTRWALVCGLTGLGLAAYIVRLNWRPMVLTETGEVIRDLSPLQANAFGGAEAKPLRLNYLANLPYYRTIEVQRISPGTGEAVKTIREIIKTNHSAFADVLKQLDRTGGANEDGLVDAVNRALRRASGVLQSEYENVNPGSVLRIPAHLRTAVKSQKQLDDPEVIRQLFAERFEQSAQPDSPERIVSIASSSQGWRVGAKFSAAGLDESEVQDALMAVLSPDEARRFRGRAMQASLVFSSRPGEGGGKAVAAITFAVIVEDASGDRYPLWMTFRRYRGDKMWWLTGVYRAVSIQALSTPPLVY